MYMVAGNDDDIDGGFAFEYLAQVVTVIQNFISKDPETLLSVGEGQEQTYLELCFKFIQRVLVINQKGVHKQDGVMILRVVIALFENLVGQIDFALPNLVGMLLAENKVAFESESPPNFRSMILQTLAMAIYNSNATTLAIFEQNQQTFTVFSNMLGYMGNFKQEFEIRRMIWGLLSILRVPSASVPALVQQQLP